ncbi:TPA: MerR family transcriptional regulator [Streptococcus pyogenes]|uniref:MerR family transcriptional regulator n=1 Tax=Streptococcus pyogenes TaxID=1314 RepID=A0A660A8D3_STRPY|nr:MerR family transcriptional regulator [Streptococcus pyogenes]EPZ48774.1 MerR HTH family regulatory protein [Streptococcus pyogenes GA40634]HER4522469.1 MerR family transcriptional regulator [Streptococcus pyogenes NGAS760]HER4525926.1 MerR family transcriptional regulator [Streptococcus pyogenes NGAS758]HER4529247.1 MerR family transcriptional regulator [Streptococcus pyogenes NGAS746]HER4530936.1 MerR family transcriptional regulator [Streptococcus pyogenes NGAS759]HER4533998.1 MerR fami
MSQFYSTGELANLAGVSIRTVQYYDQRGILIPTALTAGGRRLYTDSDLEQLRMICFLRDLGFSIAGHTPRTRKLTCSHCHQKSYCLELAKEDTVSRG